MGTENRLKQIRAANALLLEAQRRYRQDAATFPRDLANQRRLLRGLMNVWDPALPLNPAYLRLQDAILSEEREEKGVVHVASLPVTAADPRISLWRGDITRLDADAIVNAANSALLGCFIPGHNCIDNAIHSAAGLQLRAECAELMRAQGYEEPTGQAKLTKGYNLPAKHVLHTVGPVITGDVTDDDRRLLASCYRSCLSLAAENGLHSVAFCCISTGVFHFPRQEAAEIAVRTVRECLSQSTSVERVIFNVFSDSDAELYRELLGEDQTVTQGPAAL